MLRGYGFQNIAWSSPNWSATGNTGNNQSGQPNHYFYSGAPARSQTVTLDYSSLLPSITATPTNGYIELIFTSNNGSGAPNYFYMNNVVLTGGVVLGIFQPGTAWPGAAGSLAVRRRRA